MAHPLPYLPTNTSCVAHYTNACILPSILMDGGIVLWATRYGYFSDENEYIWPFSKIKPHLKHIAAHTRVEYDPEHQSFPYILSFTNGIESDFMWEKYGDRGSGVMLVFDRVRLYDYCNSFIERTGKTRYCMDVLYASSDELNFMLADAYNELQNRFPNINPIEPLYDCPAFVKNRDLHLEDEFRLIHCAYETFQMSPETIDNPIISEEIPTNLKFRNSDGRIIPYIEITLPKECLVAVCLGSNITEHNAHCIELLLKTRSYNVSIFQSRIDI